MRESAFEGLGREARSIDFSAQLSELRIPVALFYGSSDKAEIPSSINNEVIERYKKSIASFRTVEFLNSGHMIPDDEEAKYIEEINKFLDSVNPCGL